MGFTETLEAARDALIGPDPDQPLIRASLDLRDLTVLPGVFLRLDGLAGPTLQDGMRQPSRALITVYCLVPTTNPAEAMRDVEDLFSQVAAVIPPRPTTNVRHVSVPLPGAGTPATALSYEHDLKIDREEAP